MAISAVMIAGWPGMGNVALGVVEFLRARFKSVKVAEIKIDPFLSLDSVAVENGTVTAIGILERGTARLPGGVDLGVPVDRLRQAFGSPTHTEGVRDVSLWAYQDSGLVAFVAHGKVIGLWALEADRR